MNKSEKIVVLGAGACGTALAIGWTRAGNPTTLWTRSGAAAAELRETGENKKRLPGIALPGDLKVTSDLAKAVAGVGIAVAAIPAQAWRDMASDLQGHLSVGTPVVLTAKGIERGTGLLPHQVTADVLPSAIPTILSGPSFASDVGRGLPTAVTLACADGRVGKRLAETLATPALRTYQSEDMTGTALGGAVKNVLGIAAGLTDGCGLGESARAALVTRGFAEMRRLGGKLGTAPETMMGLSGLGDLMLTCTSPQSRNYRYGHIVGEGSSPDQALETVGTVEGVWTAEALLDLAAKVDVDMPVAGAVRDIVGGTPVDRVISGLMARPLTQEN